MADIIPISAIALIGSGVINLDSDSMVATLHSSDAAFTYESENYDNTYELDTNYGYTQLDKTITGQSITKDGLYTLFDIDDITWTASGGDIGPTRYCAIVDTQDNINKYVYIMDFNSSKSANDGTDFKIIPSTSGLFQIYQG